MVDFPGVTGKMCNWEIVEAVAGAKETLAEWSKNAQIYIATGAADSTELEIQRAFERVGLDQFISGYFCKANIGQSKGTTAFLNAILDKLDITATHVAMVGDSLEKDIKPALLAGIQPFWLTNQKRGQNPNKVNVIKQLNELYL